MLHFYTRKKFEHLYQILIFLSFVCLNLGQGLSSPFLFFLAILARPCQETRAIALARAGTRAGTRVKYSASAIYRTRKILLIFQIQKYFIWIASEVSIFLDEAHHHLVFALYNSRILGYRGHCEHL